MNVICLATVAVCLVAATMATQMNYGYQTYVPVHVGTGALTAGSGYGFGGSSFGLGGMGSGGGGIFNMIFFLFFFIIMINLLGSIGGDGFNIIGNSKNQGSHY